MGWGRQDSNLRRLTPAGLQPAPFAARDTTPRSRHTHKANDGIRTHDRPLTRRLLCRTELRWRTAITTATPHLRYARRLPSANRG